MKKPCKHLEKISEDFQKLYVIVTFNNNFEDILNLLLQYV